MKLRLNGPLICKGITVVSLCLFAWGSFYIPAGVDWLLKPALGSNQSSGNLGAQFSAEHIQRDILTAQGFGNRTSREKQWQTARWLEASFREMGIDVALQQYQYKGESWPNVIAKIQGKSIPEQKILALAHLDSISENKGAAEAPGGDDNGSGMAVILELARNLRNIPLDRSVMFCVFSNEEKGCPGSSAFAAEQRKSGADIKAVINIDTLGYNRPRLPFYPRAILASEGWRKKYAISKLMLKNYIKGFSYGDNSVVIAGRSNNAILVATTAIELARNPALNVRPQVKDDCG